jgi:hypothetical protein
MSNRLNISVTAASEEKITTERSPQISLISETMLLLPQPTPPVMIQFLKFENMLERAGFWGLIKKAGGMNHLPQ